MQNIDELYSTLEQASEKIQTFLDNNQVTAAHATLMLKLEYLNAQMYDLDLEAIKTHSSNMADLNNQILTIKDETKKIIDSIDAADDFIDTANIVVSSIDTVLNELRKIV